MKIKRFNDLFEAETINEGATISISLDAQDFERLASGNEIDKTEERLGGSDKYVYVVLKDLDLDEMERIIKKVRTNKK